MRLSRFHYFTILFVITFSIGACDTLSIYQDSKVFNDEYRRRFEETFISQQVSNALIRVSIRRVNARIGAIIKIKNLSKEIMILHPNEIMISSEINFVSLPILNVYQVKNDKDYIEITNHLSNPIEIASSEEAKFNYQWSGSPVMSWTVFSDIPQQHRLKLEIKGLVLQKKFLAPAVFSVRDK